MPDPRNINAWMGHCGGTDPYCQQGCSPTCANYTYMTGIETVGAYKDPSADTLVGKFGNRAANQPRVEQREVQEAMRKVQERHAQGGTQSSLPQHQVRFQGRNSTTFETSGMVNSSTVAPTSSGLTASDARRSLNNMPRDMYQFSSRSNNCQRMFDGSSLLDRSIRLITVIDVCQEMFESSMVFRADTGFMFERVMRQSVLRLLAVLVRISISDRRVDLKLIWFCGEPASATATSED
ncbi:hypothetical protein M436DRAFT_67857 [Aureobasidium namibiae CBS 147.97]|uniref:Uncharacterized protein n=1 Tax=Aureobasidium namibiae CBS 147.97 TaxID=1043004 RepID=A0A074WFU0_9PEZI|nr:uncharacterized protein M436DRAFT_67857 [Aureobasidium namibiae CBS 147.97]KEQ68727.1 hypothetical protein M436DRAFT_67857 [Aureobasidium namibiae CBS 147.97]